MGQTVADVMTHKVLSIPETASLKELVDLIQGHHLHSVPVVDAQGMLVGIVSLRDVLKTFLSRYLPLLSAVSLDETPDALDDNALEFNFVGMDEMPTVHDLMTRHPKSVRPENSLLTATVQMYMNKIHRLPVTENGKLLGIISQSDVIRTIFESQTAKK